MLRTGDWEETRVRQCNVLFWEVIQKSVAPCCNKRKRLFSAACGLSQRRAVSRRAVSRRAVRRLSACGPTTLGVLDEAVSGVLDEAW